MDKIAAFMQEDKKYSAGELEGVIDVGKTRLREILSQMVEEGLIGSEGERKQRVYFVNKDAGNPNRRQTPPTSCRSILCLT